MASSESMCFQHVRDVTENNIFMASPIWKSMMVPAPKSTLAKSAGVRILELEGQGSRGEFRSVWVEAAVGQLQTAGFIENVAAILVGRKGCDGGDGTCCEKSQDSVGMRRGVKV
jgi:hypothetical protein